MVHLIYKKGSKKTFSIEPIIAFHKNKSLYSSEEMPPKLIRIQKTKTKNMKGNVHFVNLKYGHSAVYS